jgi:cation:H+ antiporter
MGIVSLITTVPVDAKAMTNMIILFFITLFLVPIFYTGRRISRIEGSFLLAIYVLYIWYIFFIA